MRMQTTVVNRKRGFRCSGFTLAELIVIASVGSALMLMSINLVHRTMRADSDFRRQANASRALNRLGMEFRRDVNWATEVTLEEVDGELVFELELPEKIQVRYLVNESQVLREERSGDETRREQYPLPMGCRATIKELESPHRVALTIRRATPIVIDNPPVELHVEAVVGRLAQASRER